MIRALIVKSPIFIAVLMLDLLTEERLCAICLRRNAAAAILSLGVRALATANGPGLSWFRVSLCAGNATPHRRAFQSAFAAAAGYWAAGDCADGASGGGVGVEK
jgi:hypothetical protein